jgi:hypothetical protein
MTPEELGRKGWDGNEAIEWLTTVMPDRVAPPCRSRDGQ